MDTPVSSTRPPLNITLLRQCSAPQLEPAYITHCYVNMIDLPSCRKTLPSYSSFRSAFYSNVINGELASGTCFEVSVRVFCADWFYFEFFYFMPS